MDSCRERGWALPFPCSRSLKESKMNSDDYRDFCMKYILPIIAERMGFEPKFELGIISNVLFDYYYNRLKPDEDPIPSLGFMVGNKFMFVREHPNLIIYGFIHELLHIYYPRKEDESLLRYEMRIRILAIAVFWGIMIYVLGEGTAHEYLDGIPLKLTVPDYLKKNSHASLTRIKQSHRTN